MNVQFLGQVIPTVTNQGLESYSSRQIAETYTRFLTDSPIKINVFVASANALKVDSAKKAVETWAQKYFENPIIETKGFEVASGIDEQPHGFDNTLEGARNRLSNLHTTFSGSVNQKMDHSVLNVIIAMENGLIKEKINNLRNPETFIDRDRLTWVDRCVVVGEILFKDLKWHIQAVSIGVTTPRECVEQAEQAKWSKTAGSFIATKYNWNAKDWHGSIAGKSRQPIMEETILAALGLQK